MASNREQQIAAHRFGFGPQRDARPGLSARAALLDQLRRFDAAPAALRGLATRQDIAAAMPVAQGVLADDTVGQNAREVARKANRRSLQDHYLAQMQARFDVAVGSDTPFAERLVHFWANHFAVSVDRVLVLGLAGPMENEAIRRHLTGRFADMLGAVARHPAMLLYLDQTASIGPNSVIGQRRADLGKARAGLNENLAREILELHTLGVRSGYSQSDVTELARALTGFTVVGRMPGVGALAEKRRGADGDFHFLDPIHEPGPRQLLGKNYAAGGEEQARMMMFDLAIHPATARHLSTKLARHFVADDPPPALVDRLAKVFLESGGNLMHWYAALIDSPEAWAATPRKAKTPWDWMVSSARTLSPLRPMRAQALAGIFNALAQPVWRPGSPAGYADTAAAWLAPDALLRRVEVTPRLVTQASVLPDARRAAVSMLGDGLSRSTQDALAGAADAKQAMALLLLSPEFLRR